MGENVMLVATLDVRNRSIILPVGMSNVRMIESIEVVTSHLESGENVCASQARQNGESDNFRKNHSPGPIYGRGSRRALEQSVESQCQQFARRGRRR